MLRNKPLFITALIFGGIGVVLTILTGILFLNNDDSFFGLIARLFGMAKESVTASTLWQFAFIFEAAAFILGYRALVEEAEE